MVLEKYLQKYLKKKIVNLDMVFKQIAFESVFFPYSMV